MWFRKEKPTPQQLVRDLREKALTVEPSEIRIAPSPGHERAWGLLMETLYRFRSPLRCLSRVSAPALRAEVVLSSLEALGLHLASGPAVVGEMHERQHGKCPI